MIRYIILSVLLLFTCRTLLLAQEDKKDFTAAKQIELRSNSKNEVRKVRDVHRNTRVIQRKIHKQTTPSINLQVNVLNGGFEDIGIRPNSKDYKPNYRNVHRKSASLNKSTHISNSQRQQIRNTPDFRSKQKNLQQKKQRSFTQAYAQ
jgi:hypothetical protein